MIEFTTCGITDGIDMARSEHPQNSEIINLNYIRAAIEAKTGKRLKLTEIRQLLVEEGLITASAAKKYAPIFNDYREYFRTEEFSVDELPKSERDF